MSSSYIEFRYDGLWVPDGFSELIARYLLKIINGKYELPLWMDAMRNRLNEIEEERFPGWVNFGFDRYLDTDTKIEYIKDLFDELIGYVESKGEFISKDELNCEFDSNSNKSSWKIDIETKEFINYIQEIRKLFG
ncbi:MAG: hypothetical protein J0M30_08190 [Chitinophagales bacterium]|nr:hypothetical protein [Chitinophagales bacterium]